MAVSNHRPADEIRRQDTVVVALAVVVVAAAAFANDTWYNQTGKHWLEWWTTLTAKSERVDQTRLLLL